MEQPEWDGMEWREVDDGMEVQQEWVVMVWTEVEPAAFVEDVGCGTRLEWRAADSAKRSDALRRQSETGSLLLLTLKLRVATGRVTAKAWLLKARVHHSVPLPGWVHGRTGAGNRSTVQQIRYIQSNMQKFVKRLKGPPLSSLDPVDG